MNRPLGVAGTLVAALSLFAVGFDARVALRPSGTATTITFTTGPSAPTGTTTATTSGIPGPQAQSGQQDEDRVVTLGDASTTVTAPQDSRQARGLQCFWQGGTSPPGRGRHRLGQGRDDQAFYCKKRSRQRRATATALAQPLLWAAHWTVKNFVVAEALTAASFRPSPPEQDRRNWPAT